MEASRSELSPRAPGEARDGASGPGVRIAELVGVFLVAVALLYTREPRCLWPRAATALKCRAP